MQDIDDRLVSVSFFALLDKPGILTDQADIEHEHDSVLTGDFPDLTHVGHGEGLTADEVGGGLHSDVGDAGRAVLLDHVLELGGVDVALERIGALDLERLIREDLEDFPTVDVDVGFGGGEVVVHGDHIALFHKGLGNNVFSGATLVNRKHEAHAKDILDRFLHAGEAGGSRIRIVGHHHGTQLLIAHRIGSAVGQHIEEDILGLEKKGVESGFTDSFQAPFYRTEMELLNDTHLVQFKRDIFATEKGDAWRGIIF
ncbi:MAG: hypothetical protein BWY82_01333 [Verrucomicrobia bacterium ADurb.Bin474]|nr:MAG: hypothetical protein BWY82_01333 [Verrucomicrobia bacterium ADurb.Bin474]